MLHALVAYASAAETLLDALAFICAVILHLQVEKLQSAVAKLNNDKILLEQSM